MNTIATGFLLALSAVGALGRPLGGRCGARRGNGRTPPSGAPSWRCASSRRVDDRDLPSSACWHAGLRSVFRLRSSLTPPRRRKRKERSRMYDAWVHPKADLGSP